jgi:hypothetical protein
MAERELHTNVALCTRRGELDPAAVGWSRRPLHDGALPAGFPRRKRWEYWGVLTERHMLSVCVADIDYAGLGFVSVVSLHDGRAFDALGVTALGRGARLPDRVGGGAIRFEQGGVRIFLEPEEAGTRLRAQARSLRGERVEIELMVDRPRDTLNVAVPLAGRCFQLTSKHVGLGARGAVNWDGADLDLADAAACLDFGRGVWPYGTRWRWAAASGVAEGHDVALNLGGLWTDGTGVTENGFWVDGRLHKLSGDLAFVRERSAGALGFATVDRGWTIRGDGVDLRLTPLRRRRVGLDLGALAARLDWCAGTFSGSLRAEDGASVRVDGLRGWAEEMHARW